MDAKQLKRLILSGQIKTFGELVEKVGIPAMTEVLGCSDTHIRTVISEPGALRLGELFKLSEWLRMSRWRVAEIFCS